MGIIIPIIILLGCTRSETNKIVENKSPESITQIFSNANLELEKTTYTDKKIKILYPQISSGLDLNLKNSINQR